MRYLVLLLLTGCAHTTIYEDGKPVLKTQADATNVSFVTARTRFHADRLDHSTPMIAQGRAMAEKYGAFGSVITAIGGTAIFKK